MKTWWINNNEMLKYNTQHVHKICVHKRSHWVWFSCGIHLKTIRGGKWYVSEMKWVNSLSHNNACDNALCLPDNVTCVIPFQLWGLDGLDNMDESIIVA